MLIQAVNSLHSQWGRILILPSVHLDLNVGSNSTFDSVLYLSRDQPGIRRFWIELFYLARIETYERSFEACAVREPTVDEAQFSSRSTEVKATAISQPQRQDF